MKKIFVLFALSLILFQQGIAQVRQTVAVLGDSYSTYEGFIPEGNAVWYHNPAHTDQTDVSSVE